MIAYPTQMAKRAATRASSAREEGHRGNLPSLDGADPTHICGELI
jgi:hypothetical protein